MQTLSKVLLVAIPLSLVIGCSSSDKEKIEDALTKDSVSLSDLAQNVVTYQNTSTQVSHTDDYCPGGSLGIDNKDGTWVIAGPALTVTPISGTAYTYLTTNSKLEKNKEYSTTTSEKFKVTKIEVTVCL